jgi:hypothetical protein
MSSRFKDVNWNVGGDDNAGVNPSMDGAQLAVLMDMRDELKTIRYAITNVDRLLSCSNFTRIPAKIDAIRKNTERKKKSVVKKAKS